MTDKKKCSYCGKTLRPINKIPKDTNNYNKDWPSRKLHKKCWKEKQLLDDLKDFLLKN